MSSKKGHHDLTSHSLIEIREPPASLVALRKELLKPENRDIYLIASAEPNFELVLGKIATVLNVIVDGDYDVYKFCDMLVKKMQERGKQRSSIILPH